MQQGKRFDGKVALVTGGGSGIGAATARRIAAEGGKVVVTGRRAEPIRALAQDIDGAWLAGDAADPDHLQAAVDLCVSRFGGADILVANAGTEHLAQIEHMDLGKWRETFALNIDGPMLASRAIIPAMRRRGGGAIVHVASVAACVAIPFGAAYMASKAALLGLSRSLTLEYGPEGIRSNVICPALVPTEMTERTMAMVGAAQGISGQDVMDRIARVYPLRRYGTPQDIAAAIAFLASDDAAFIAGTVMMADGGASVIDVATLA